MTPQDDDSLWASPQTRAEAPAVPVASAPTDGSPTAAVLGRGRRAGLIKAVALAVAVVAAAGTAIAALHHGGPDPTAAPGADASTVPAVTGYVAPGDLCQQADFTRLRPPFNTIGELYTHGSKQPTLEIAACDGTTGNAEVTGRFSFEVQVSTRPDELAELFDEQRASVAARGPVTSITGLGTKADQYVAAGQTGLTVEVYDENMLMRLSWSTMRAGDQPPAGLDTALVETCRSTLRLLRAG